MRSGTDFYKNKSAKNWSKRTFFSDRRIDMSKRQLKILTSSWKIKLEFSALAKLFADSVDQAKHGGGATIPPQLQVRLERTREKK